LIRLYMTRLKTCQEKIKKAWLSNDDEAKNLWFSWRQALFSFMKIGNKTKIDFRLLKTIERIEDYFYKNK
jgi:hypothetical protein